MVMVNLPGTGQFTKFWLNVVGNGRSRECSVVMVNLPSTG